MTHIVKKTKLYLFHAVKLPQVRIKFYSAGAGEFLPLCCCWVLWQTKPHKNGNCGGVGQNGPELL